MAKQTQRSVKRNSIQGRQGLVRQYNYRPWYQLADWLAAWLSASAWWIVLGIALLFAPIALLAIVLGAHSVSLQLFGHGWIANGNSVGLAAAAFVVEFALLALAVRPLRAMRKAGMRLMLMAAAVHLIHSLILVHAVTGTAIFLLALYLYWQLLPRFR